jgi:hypothetical protein
MSSRNSTRFGMAMQLGALSLIGYAWLFANRIPVAWHALVSIIAVMLPTQDLVDIAKGGIRAWAKRGK